MLCQNETGVISGSEIFFNTVGAATRRLLYYVNFCGHYYCERGYKIRRKYVDNLLLMLVEHGSMRLEYRGRSYTAAGRYHPDGLHLPAILRHAGLCGILLDAHFRPQHF